MKVVGKAICLFLIAVFAISAAPPRSEAASAAEIDEMTVEECANDLAPWPVLCLESSTLKETPIAMCDRGF